MTTLPRVLDLYYIYLGFQVARSRDPRRIVYWSLELKGSFESLNSPQELNLTQGIVELKESFESLNSPQSAMIRSPRRAMIRSPTYHWLLINRPSGTGPRLHMAVLYFLSNYWGPSTWLHRSGLSSHRLWPSPLRLLGVRHVSLTYPSLRGISTYIRALVLSQGMMIIT